MESSLVTYETETAQSTANKTKADPMTQVNAEMRRSDHLTLEVTSRHSDGLTSIIRWRTSEVM
jgi:hypothetical protein